MNNLRQYIRQTLLIEAAKQPEDLEPEHIVVMLDLGETVTFSLMFRTKKGSQFQTGRIAITQDARRNGPCLNAWEVISAEARDGYGPLLYDLAMEHAGRDGLMADRRSVSRAAMRVWDFYLNSRPGVRPKQLDVARPIRFKGTITPDDESDDCRQDKYFNHHYAEGDNWEKAWSGTEEDIEDYLASPMTKAYVKTGTPVTDKLRELGKLEE